MICEVLSEFQQPAGKEETANQKGKQAEKLGAQSHSNTSTEWATVVSTMCRTTQYQINMIRFLLHCNISIAAQTNEYFKKIIHLGERERKSAKSWRN